MSQHLDLEEQEQLDELKHFWSKYGNLISGVLIVVMMVWLPGGLLSIPDRLRAARVLK